METRTLDEYYNPLNSCYTFPIYPSVELSSFYSISHKISKSHKNYSIRRRRTVMVSAANIDKNGQKLL